MCIEIRLHQFYKSNFDNKHRYVDINQNYKIDLKEWAQIDNDDSSQRKKIKRGKNLAKERAETSTRFIDSSHFVLTDKDGEKKTEEKF